MATDQTANYQLNQWLSTDPVVREDFNADNAKIEAALSELRSSIVSGDVIVLVVDSLRKDIAELEARVEQLEAT